MRRAMADINWATELRKIEREYDGLPPEPTPAEARARREAERREQQKERERIYAIGTAIRLILVVALAVGIWFWPYPRDCGPRLIAYLAAATVIVAGGIWSVVRTWIGRSPILHAVALTATLWGMLLIAAQALPRVGYARVDPENPPSWWCG
jgi:hypothetical protein